MSVVEALRDRLKVLEDEILRVAEFAAQAVETSAQDNYWQFARDLQREAREVRLQIARMTGRSESPDPPGAKALGNLADFRGAGSAALPRYCTSR
jgi:hypothetical protein